MSQDKLFIPKAILIAIAIISLGAALGVIFYSLSLNKSAPVAVVPTTEPTVESMPISTATPMPTTTPEVETNKGILFYISESDLWQANENGKENIRLIDNDKISEAGLSPNKNSIAYAANKDIKETITTHEGKKEEKDFVRHDLFIADRRGANSYLVKNGVMRWGWVPSTDLLWYESSELGQFMDWQYLGKNDIWIFDVNNKKSNLLVEDNGMLNIKWSFDGSKVLYIGYKTGGNLSLRVVDRNTLLKKELFDIPYVGGDRGGPPPIPSFYWDNDSKFIYTVFTSLIWNKNDELKNKFTSGYLSGWKIPVDESEPSRIFPDVPSAVLNDETYPSAVFNEDFSKVAYTRYKEKDVKGLEPSSWFYNKSLPLSLVVYDTRSQNEKILIENINSKEGINKFWYYLSGKDDKEIFFGGDYLYIFTGEKEKNMYESLLVLKKINITTGKGQEFRIELTAKTQYYPNLSNIGHSKDQEVIHFVFEDEVIYFYEKQQLFAKIINNIESIKFY